MSKPGVGLTALSVALLALALNRFPTTPTPRPVKAPRKLPWFTLPQDLPDLGLFKNNVYAIDPDALIYLGDPVAVRLTGSKVRIEPYSDDLIDCVVGLVLA